MTKTIWRTPDNQWAFLIPEDAELPAGDVTIRTLLGREIQVDADALTDYVVPREVAEAYLSGVLREGLEQVKDGAMSFLQALFDSSRRSPQESRWNVDLLADLFDQPTEAVRNDPQATKDGLKSLLGEAVLFFENVKSGDDSRNELARRQMAGFLNLLELHGINVADGAYDIPDALMQAYRQGSDDDDDTPPE